MVKVFEVTTEVAGLEQLADRLGALSDDGLDDAIRQAVNDVADRTYQTVKQRMSSGLSLSEAYVTNRLGVRPAAKGARARAVITAKGLVTTLGHYASQQHVQAAKSPIVKLKGDVARGIPRGQKQAGVSVEVKPGNRKMVRANQNDVFTLVKNGKQVLDSEGNPLIVRRTGGTTRNGKDRLEALYGPSVYQVFKSYIGEMFDGITDNLQDEIIAQAEAAIEKAL